MLVYRLEKAKYAAMALDGEGARRQGGRWNSTGQRAVYLSEHLSLAALEVLVHVSRQLAGEYVAMALEVPDGLPIYRPGQSDLPPSWRDVQVRAPTQSFGDEWLNRASEALMCIPSVLIPEEHNYLLNPDHPDAKRIKAHPPVPFSFDPRLFKG
ncbi:MAG TPA: RES family NAD+ phosphorylase [Myxococcales bacterium]|nr:RES family NAD+ phosphorylase [Myxococcales bacterium]